MVSNVGATMVSWDIIQLADVVALNAASLTGCPLTSVTLETSTASGKRRPKKIVARSVTNWIAASAGTGGGGGGGGGAVTPWPPQARTSQSPHDEASLSERLKTTPYNRDFAKMRRTIPSCHYGNASFAEPALQGTEHESRRAGDGKHGNYSTREDCDAGGLAGSDTCDQNDRFYRFPVRFPQQNIWSRAIPCFWPRHTFYGWQGLEQVGSTACSDILAQYAGW